MQETQCSESTEFEHGATRGGTQATDSKCWENWMLFSEPGDEGGAPGGRRRKLRGPCGVEMSVRHHKERVRGQSVRWV